MFNSALRADFTPRDFIHLWCPHWWTCGAGAMCTAFSALGLTSALQTLSRAIDSFWLHHFVRQSWNNLKCLSKMKWNQRSATDSSHLTMRQSAADRSKWFQIIPKSTATFAKRCKCWLGASNLDPTPTAGQVLIVTSILAWNNLLNSTTLTFYHFTARSTAHTF